MSIRQVMQHYLTKSKFINIITSVIIILTSFSFSTIHPENPQDKAYKDLSLMYENAINPKSRELQRRIDGRKNPRYFINMYKIMVQYMNLGMELWFKYPKDKRRYNWFKQFDNYRAQNLHFWKNIDSSTFTYLNKSGYLTSYTADIDTPQLNKWLKNYPTIKTDFLQNIKNKSEQTLCKIQLEENEVKFFLTMNRNQQFRKSINSNNEIISHITTIIKNISKEKTAGEFTSNGDLKSEIKHAEYAFVRTLDFELLSGYRHLGIDDDKLILFLRELTSINNPTIQKWARAKNRLFSLTQTGVSFDELNPTHEIINLSNYRNQKVVLLDFWSLGCVSCITRMPYLKTLYEKYSDKGFEVISICTEDSSRLESIDKIINKIGATWPLIIAGDSRTSNSLTSNVFNLFGFQFVPQLLLFDKSGKLIIYNNELMEGDFESLLQKSLE